MGLIDDFSFKDCRSFPLLSEVRSSFRVKLTPAPLAAAVCTALLRVTSSWARRAGSLSGGIAMAKCSSGGNGISPTTPFLAR